MQNEYYQIDFLLYPFDKIYTALHIRFSEELIINADNKKGPRFHNDLSYLSVDEIYPDAVQPRKRFPQESLKELSDSIAQYGILNPSQYVNGMENMSLSPASADCVPQGLLGLRKFLHRYWRQHGGGKPSRVGGEYSATRPLSAKRRHSQLIRLLAWVRRRPHKGLANHNRPSQISFACCGYPQMFWTLCEAKIDRAARQSTPTPSERVRAKAGCTGHGFRAHECLCRRGIHRKFTKISRKVIEKDAKSLRKTLFVLKDVRISKTHLLTGWM